MSHTILAHFFQLGSDFSSVQIYRFYRYGSVATASFIKVESIAQRWGWN